MNYENEKIGVIVTGGSDSWLVQVSEHDDQNIIKY